jgi:hypothetical protein
MGLVLGIVSLVAVACKDDVVDHVSRIDRMTGVEGVGRARQQNVEER